MSYLQEHWSALVARDPSLIRDEGCAWGDLVSFDPSLQGQDRCRSSNARDGGRVS